MNREMAAAEWRCAIKSLGAAEVLTHSIDYWAVDWDFRNDTFIWTYP